MTDWRPAVAAIRRHGTVAIALAAAVALVLLEQRHGLFGLIFDPRAKDVASPASQLVGFLALAVVAWRWRRMPNASRTLVVATGLALVAVTIDHHRYGAGDDFEREVAAIVALAALGWWVARRGPTARRALTVVASSGFVFLAASGALLATHVGTVAGLALKNAHATVGLWFAPLAAATIALHVATTEPGGLAGGRPDARRTGLGAAVCLCVLLVTAASRVATGAALPTNATWLHVALAATAIWLGAYHTVTARAGAVPGSPRAPFARIETVATAVLVVCTGVAPALYVALRVRAPVEARGEIAMTPTVRQRLLANPRTGVTACTLAGGGVPEALLSVAARQPGCANALACHVPETDQWGRSAHRFAANPAYGLVVRGLVAEEGIASARLCASCHDPLPLLAGRMTPGEPYPRATSEGVTCLVCHTMRRVSDVTPRDGRYRLTPPGLLPHQVDVPAVQNMMVYDNLEMHRAVVADDALRGDELCASCHALTLHGVALRGTYAEWEAAQARLPTAARRPCRSCHMLPLPELTFGDRAPHDHTMRGGNIAVALLAHDPTASRVRLMAEALALDAVVHREPTGALTLHVTLGNVRGGHGFPTAPLDLVQYWFEVRDAAGNPGAPWQRLGAGSVFPQGLTDSAGVALDRHEIWRMAHAEGPGRIAPGETRGFAYHLAASAVPGAPAGTEMDVRLMYQRYPDRLVPELRTTGLRVDPIEVLRRRVRVDLE